MNKELIERFANFLETVITDDKFDFTSIVREANEHNCGTVCCAAGWLPAFDPTHWRWIGEARYMLYVEGRNNHSLSREIAEYFGLESIQASNIFFNGHYDPYGGVFYGKTDSYVTRRDVINALKALIKWHITSHSSYAPKALKMK